ncbi:hypothetical protein ABK040_004854 [Willaertia magna]
MAERLTTKDTELFPIKPSAFTFFFIFIVLLGCSTSFIYFHLSFSGNNLFHILQFTISDIFNDEDNSLIDFIFFPKDLLINYPNVTRKSVPHHIHGNVFGAPELTVPPKIKNGYHCPYLGMNKHSHYILVQNYLPTLCIHTLEKSLYCNVNIVKNSFTNKLAIQSLIPFNRNKRIRSYLFPQCCDNFGFLFNNLNILKLIEGWESSIDWVKIRKDVVITRQIYELLKRKLSITNNNNNTAILLKQFVYKQLNILDFIEDNNIVKQLHKQWPEIIYPNSKWDVAVKFGLWSHEFTKYGTCITNQLYHNYLFNNLDNLELKEKLKYYKSDPQLYFELSLILQKKFDIFSKKKHKLLKLFIPSNEHPYLVKDIKRKIKKLFDMDVILTCIWTSQHKYAVLYQILNCLDVNNVQLLADYLINRKYFNNLDKETHKKKLTEIMSKITSTSCQSVIGFNRTQHFTNYFNNVTDYLNHLHFSDESNLLHGRECLDNDYIIIPDGLQSLRYYHDAGEGRILKFSPKPTTIKEQEIEEQEEMDEFEDDETLLNEQEEEEVFDEEKVIRQQQAAKDQKQGETTSSEQASFKVRTTEDEAQKERNSNDVLSLEKPKEELKPPINNPYIDEELPRDI